MSGFAFTESVNGSSTPWTSGLVIGSGMHSHPVSSWDAITIGDGSGMIASSDSIVIGDSAVATSNNGLAIGNGAFAASSHTHTIAGHHVDALPERASVRFLVEGKPFTGEIVSSNTEIGMEPIYVVQPDSPVPKTGTKPIALTHSRVERITLLQRFTEAVWAPEVEH